MMSRNFTLRIAGLLMLSMLVLFACKKEKTDDGGNQQPEPDPVGGVPASFSRKILLEEFTGEWNPNCPTGADSLKAMLLLDTGRVIAAAIHQGDWLAIAPFFDALNIHFGGISGFPRAAINRKPAAYGSQLDSSVISIFNWRQNLLPLLNQSTSIGLAMVNKLDGDLLQVKVHIGTNDSLVADTRLTVYLTEDSVSAQNQMNAPPGYLHHRVVRKVISAYLGDPVDLSAGGKVIREYSLSLSGLYQSKKNLSLVAFVHVAGSTVKLHEVLNCRQAGLDTTQVWD